MTAIAAQQAAKTALLFGCCCNSNSSCGFSFSLDSQYAFSLIIETEKGKAVKGSSWFIRISLCPKQIHRRGGEGGGGGGGGGNETDRTMGLSHTVQFDASGNV